MSDPVFNQNGFRFYEDDGAWTARKAENVNDSIASGTNLILRVEVEVTNSKNSLNTVFLLYAQKNGTGGYNQVTTTSTNGIQIAASPNFADEDLDNNNRLTSSSLTFTGGILQEENSIGDSGNIDFSGPDHWEIGICLAIDAANSNPGDYFDFEIRHSDTTQLDGYTREPRLTRSTPASDSQPAYIHGKDTASNNREAYIHGSADVADSRSAFIEGATTVTDSREAYVHGVDTASDNREAYIHGQDTISSNREAYVHGQASASDNREAYIHGQASASSQRAGYIAGQQAASDSRAAYIEGTAGAASASDSREAYIHGVDTTSDSREAYIHGSVNVSSNREAYIQGQDTTADNRSAYISGGVNVSDNRSAYIEGFLSCPTVDVQGNEGRISTCNSIGSYGRAISNATPTSDVEALLKYRFAETTSQAIFRTVIRGSSDWASDVTPTKGYEVAIACDGGYTIYRIESGSRTSIGSGAWTGSTNAYWIRFQAIGTQIKFRIWQDGSSEPGAWDNDIDDSVSGFTTAGVLQLAMSTISTGSAHTIYLDDISYHTPSNAASDNREAYIHGVDTTSDSREAYIAGGINVSSSRSAYIHGVDTASDSREAYIHGVDTASDNREAYIHGSVNVSASREAYIAGGINVSSSRSAYIHGKDTASDNRAAYIHGKDTASDNREAYIEGANPVATDSRHAYIFGFAGEPFSNIPAYIHGVDTAQDSREAYIRGKETSTDSRSAYIAGVDTAQDSREAYIHGKSSSDDSRSAYIEGYDIAASSQPAYIAGGLQASSSRQAYIEGVIQGTDRATFKGMWRGMYKRIR